jgi:hypothetical protein
LPSSVHARTLASASSPRVERRGEGGERYLDMAVTGAAGLEDRYEARMIDPDMIPEQALARLREPG